MDIKQKNPTLGWNNEINQHNFYEHDTCETILRGYAERGGLASGCDVETIFNTIRQARNLLDVGSGYGRVIDKLLKMDFSGELHALEKSSLLQETLKKNFGNKIKNYHCDILDFKTNLKFDAILSMWSGMSDFTPNEQARFIKKLASILTDNGKIIIDTSVWDQKPLNAIGLQSQNYIIEETNSILHGYIPTSEEIQKYAENAGLMIVEHFDYYTETNRRRLLYFLAFSV